MELDAGIGTGPRRIGHFFPKLARLYRFCDAALAMRQIPFAVFQHRLQEFIRHAHRIVGVLAGDRKIGFRIPIGVVRLERDFLVALFGKGDDALDVIVRDHRFARGLDLAAQRRVLGRIKAIIIVAVAIHAGLQHRGQMPFGQLGTGHHGGDLLFLDDFPVDEIFDVGMVDINHHHFGGAPCGATRFDGPGCAVANFQKAHQAGRFAAARKLFAFAAQRREIGACAGAIFEQACLTRPKVHDPAFVDEVIFHRLDEAGVRLWVFVRRIRFHQPAAFEIHIVMALAGTIDAIGPMQPGVEPLRGIRRGLLCGQHVAHLVIESLCVIFLVEIAALPAPIGPGSGQPVEHLLGGTFADFFKAGGRIISRFAPQEFGNIRFGHRLQRIGHTGFAEIFLGQHIACHLAPCRGHFDVRL